MLVFSRATLDAHVCICVHHIWVSHSVQWCLNQHKLKMAHLYIYFVVDWRATHAAVTALSFNTLQHTAKQCNALQQHGSLATESRLRRWQRVPLQRLRAFFLSIGTHSFFVRSFRTLVVTLWKKMCALLPSFSICNLRCGQVQCDLFDSVSVLL